MRTFAERLSELAQNGYRLAEAQAKVAHDALLLAMHKSGFKENCTIKGGVVMCELSRESRRTTMDLDIDFMHTGWLIDGPNIPGRPFWVMRHRTPLLT